MTEQRAWERALACANEACRNMEGELDLPAMTRHFRDALSFAESAKSPSDSVSEAAERLLEFRVGELPSQGWLRDNDASRLALAELSAALQSIKDQGNG